MARTLEIRNPRTGANDYAISPPSREAMEARCKELRDAQPAIVRGSVENSGQLCCAIERVYVQRGVYDAVCDRVVERMRALQMNMDDIKSGELGPINAGGMWINDFDTMGGVGARAEKTAFGCSGLGGTRYGYGGFGRFLRKKAIVIRSVAA